MEPTGINRRTDDQLKQIFTEAGRWAIVGQQGTVLSVAGNLRNALDRAASYAESGATVISLARLPFDNIIVDASQMRRLRGIIACREMAPIKFTEARAETAVEAIEERLVS